MKLISKEEAAAIPKRLQNRIHPVRNRLMQMAKDEHLFVDRKEWNWKYKTPSAICRSIESESNLQFECYVADDKSGWIILRTA